MTLRNLFSSAIDYAGTFPPAALTLAETLKQASVWRQESTYPWLMGRVALGVDDICQTTSESLFRLGATDGSPWVYTAIGKNAWEDELAKLQEFALRERGAPIRQTVVAYENKIHADAAFFKKWTPFANQYELYVEIPLEAGWKELATQTVSHFQESPYKDSAFLGLKFRTGGKVIPTPEALAQALSLCAKSGVKFKATQGLHHPISSEKDFGFINLFFALALAYIKAEKAEVIQACLSDTSQKAFRVSKKGIQWKDYLLDPKMILAARHKHCASFGSCSLEEPEEYLIQWSQDNEIS